MSLLSAIQSLHPHPTPGFHFVPDSKLAANSGVSLCSQEEEEEDEIAGNVNDSNTAANSHFSFVPDSKCAANLRSSLHPWPTRAIATVSALNSKSSGNSPDLRSGTGAATATSKDPPVTPSKKAFHPLSKDEFDALDNDQKFKASIEWFRNAGESFSDFIKLVETLDSGTTEHACEVIDSFGNACKSHLDDERKEHLDKLKKRKVPDEDNDNNSHQLGCCLLCGFESSMRPMGMLPHVGWPESQCTRNHATCAN